MLDKITKKYNELKAIKRNKRFGWVAFSYIYITMFICIYFGLKGLFSVGLGISILICSIITFVYFNIDFTNIVKSIKEFKFEESMINISCVLLSIFAIMLILIGTVSKESEKAETKVKYKLECLSGGIEVTQISK